ncbi:MAG TPA: class II D-tagatose-bisphosphate aldolase, non-catalytic subunit [Anaerolineales bacterium]|nr:class II D-tagatose-bisphosphate aldolase, non-catalytic subunit [Anaerolineales bacterium]
MNPNILDEIVQAQKRGEARGIVSVCSAHPTVLQAAMRRAARTGAPLLIESTCNQVNQFGGYTGMPPADFVRFLFGIAAQNGLPPDRLLLGGDHLGPSVWQAEPAGEAMQKAAGLVQAYVQAGFVKIHLDASMRLGGDDPDKPLDVELVARRTAQLAGTAEASATPASLPRYVIGTEVPIPGGALAHEAGVRVTSVEDAGRTLEVTRAAFREAGLESAWERVVALVVQPGVEFGDDFVLDYRPAAADALARFSETTPFVYEAHSTDYQTRESLQDLVNDHFAILKVGPALTFAYREAIFALVRMENELIPAAERSNLVATLEAAMLRNPQHWQRYYRGTPQDQAFARMYSLSDRVRYYWSDLPVQIAVEKLVENLSRAPLPESILEGSLPVQYEHILDGSIENTPTAVILDRVQTVLKDYASACGK